MIQYQWHVSHNDQQAPAFPLLHLHQFLLLPFSSEFCWQPGQQTCSLDTVHIQKVTRSFTQTRTRARTHARTHTGVFRFYLGICFAYLLPGNFSQLLIFLDHSPKKKVSTSVPLYFTSVLSKRCVQTCMTFRQLEKVQQQLT